MGESHRALVKLQKGFDDSDPYIYHHCVALQKPWQSHNNSDIREIAALRSQ